MLTLFELEDLFTRLGTPEAGRNLVRKARREAPVRPVKSHLSNVITRFCSRKMQQVISAESRTVELPAILRYEHDPKVLEFHAQPVKLFVDLPDKNGRILQTAQFPDFLVVTEDGIFLDEWREEPRLLRLAMKYPGRTYRGADGWRFPAMETLLADQGITYRLRSSDEHPGTLIQNLQFLGDYLDPEAPAVPTPVLGRLLERFTEQAAIHLNELLAMEGVEADDIYKAIADEALAFDVDNDLIQETDRVLVYRDRATMAFHRKVMADTSALGLERLDVNLEMGMRVAYDDAEFTIGPMNRTNITLVRGQEGIELAFPFVEKLIHSGRLVVCQEAPSSETTETGLATLAAFAPEILEIALKRSQWVTWAATTGAQATSIRSLQRYRKCMREAGATAIDQHLALVPNYHNCGRRQRQLVDPVLNLIHQVIKEHYNTPRCLSKRAAYLYFVNACHEAGLPPCSERTFGREVTKLKSVGAREGKRRAYQEAAIVWYLKLEEPIHGVRPFQYVHIDHTELQVQLIHGETGKNLGRPWLTLAIDAESRAVVGFYLSFEPPSYRSCMMVIRDIVRRHGRLPATFILDNGKEFHCAALLRLCALFGVDIRYRPAGQPRFGSVMERIFGTTQTQLINRLSGNTQVLLHARMATKSVLPENFAECSLPGLHGALDYYFTTLYGGEPHPAHGETPVEHLDKRLRETGLRRRRLVVYNQVFMIESCPSPVDSPTRIVDRQRGVRVNHVWYFSEKLRRPGLDGKDVEVRIDPWDIRQVFVLVGKQWVRCLSKYVGLLRNYTEVELRYYLAELNTTKGLKKKDLTPERAAEWLKVLDAKAFDKRLGKVRFRQGEAKYLYEPMGMGSIANDSEGAVPVHQVVVADADIQMRAEALPEASTTTRRPKAPGRPKTKVVAPSRMPNPHGKECDEPYELM
jgi:putative transposase